MEPLISDRPDDDWPHPWLREDDEELDRRPSGQPRCAEFFDSWTRWSRLHNDTAISAALTKRRALLSRVLADIPVTDGGRKTSLMRERSRLRVSIRAMEIELERRKEDEGATAEAG